jgi:hypothetical protein
VFSLIGNTPHAPVTAWGSFFMKVTFDGLEWEVEELPIGSSTPDEQFEVSYNATAECPYCGSKIDGTANYWSDSEDMLNAWLQSIRYKECECQEDGDEGWGLDEDYELKNTEI